MARPGAAIDAPLRGPDVRSVPRGSLLRLLPRAARYALESKWFVKLNSERPGWRPGLVRGAPLALLAGMLLVLRVPAPLLAQGWAGSVELDNDFFKGFSPTRSTDFEYTHGAAVTLVRNGRSDLCRDRRIGARLLHRIFTPRDERVIGGQRRPAGWVRVTLGCGLATASARDSGVGVAFGLVGPGAGGEAIQRLTHRVLGFREPSGWERQLDSRVDLGVWWVRQRRFADESSHFDGWVEGRAEVGVIRSFAGLQVGGLVTAPFLPGVKVTGSAGAILQGHDYLLSGLRPIPLVPTASFGARVSMLGVTASYEVLFRGASYHAEPGGFAFGRIAIAFDG